MLHVCVLCVTRHFIYEAISKSFRRRASGNFAGNFAEMSSRLHDVGDRVTATIQHQWR